VVPVVTFHCASYDGLAGQLSPTLKQNYNKSSYTEDMIMEPKLSMAVSSYIIIIYCDQSHYFGFDFFIIIKITILFWYGIISIAVQ